MTKSIQTILANLKAILSKGSSKSMANTSASYSTLTGNVCITTGGSNYANWNPTTGSVGVYGAGGGSGGGGGIVYSVGGTTSANTTWVNANGPFTYQPNNQPLTVNGGGTFTGTVDAADVMIDGVSIKKMLESIQDRLAILVPDPAKLEKFAALKASYEDYKLLEKLCTDNPPDPDA